MIIELVLRATANARARAILCLSLSAVGIVVALSMLRSAPPPHPARAPASAGPPRSFPDDPVLQRLADTGAIVDAQAYSKNNRDDMYTTVTFQEKTLDSELLLELGRIRHLRYVILVRCRFKAHALAALRNIAGPVAIEFKGCTLASGMLADVDGAACIERIRFVDMDLDDDLLSGITALPNLRAFTASGLRLSGAGLGFLRNSPHLAELVLGHTGLDDAMLEKVCDDHDFVILGIAGTQISDEATRTIATHRKLEQLFVNNCRIGDKGVERLRSLEHLTLLNLDGTDVTDEGMTYVGELRNLETLGLSNTKVTIAGVRKLVGVPRLRVIANRGAGFSASEVKTAFGRDLMTDW